MGTEEHRETPVYIAVRPQQFRNKNLERCTYGLPLRECIGAAWERVSVEDKWSSGKHPYGLCDNITIGFKQSPPEAEDEILAKRK
jgi:hypothetical protein